MSKKKHKGNHAARTEVRAAKNKAARMYDPATADKPRRVYIRNGLYIFLTSLVIIGVVALLVVFQLLGWWDTLPGSIGSVFAGIFGVMCVYDLALLITTCLTFGEGMVNAGKDAEGNLMLFHASSVVRIELRDKAGQVLPEGQRVYKNVDLTFLMESGRINRRHFSRLTEKHLAAVRAAVEAEKKVL